MNEHHPDDDEELRELRRKAAIGMDVKAFMQSDAGRHLSERANEEMEAAKEDLLTLDLQLQRKEATHAQLRGRVAAGVLTWLADIVTEGEQAALAYQQADHGY